MRPKWALKRYGKDWTLESVFHALWRAGKQGVANEAYWGNFDKMKKMWPEIHDAFRSSAKDTPKHLASEDVAVKVIAEWRLLNEKR